MTFDLEPDLDNANVGKYFVFFSVSIPILVAHFF